MSLYKNYFGISEDTALPDKDALISQQAETIRQMTELLRGYRTKHRYCVPIGSDDDRCPLCIKADLLLKEPA